MSEMDSVISSLKAGLKQAPEDIGLILHLGNLLDDNEMYEEALVIFQQALALEPTNYKALQGAHSAAVATNNTTLTSAYEQLLNILTSQNESSAKNVARPSSQTKTLNARSDDAEKDSTKQTHNNRVRGAELRLVSENDDSTSFVNIENSNVYLDDVGGMDHVKRRLHLAFLAPLQNPEMMKAYGKSVKGGLLLYGPPGCGKTFIARALAGELGAKFINIGLTDILDMYIGESERKLHEVFETARRNSPIVLFIDELDAIGQKRSQIRSSGMRGLVNQLLTEMDSVNSDNENLFILSATNHPWDVDTALRRPGRFDRVVAVFPPDELARKSILAFNLKNKPVGEIDIAFLAHKTHQFSGADLAHLCDSAVEYVLEESLSSGKVRSLNTDDFEKPLQEIKPSTRAWFETARNYAMFANEGGQYDDLLDYINQHKL